MSRYKEYYSKMSVQLKAWRSKITCINKKIKRLEEFLAPSLIGHFEGRNYTQRTQEKINKLNTLKRELQNLKDNRPEPKKSTAPKIRGKIIKRYTTAELWGRFHNLSKNKKLEILFRTLNINYLEGEKLQKIIESMGYTKTESEWVKN